MQKTRILIADNDKVHLRIMGHFLRRKGYTVVVARSVPEAKQVLQNKSIDLALLDVRLTDDTDRRDFSGLSLAAIAPRVPKIVVTRYPSYESVRLALRSVNMGRAMANDFVEKPRKLAEIHQAIESAVNDAIRAKEFRAFFDRLKNGNREAWRCLWNEEAWRLITMVQRHGFSRAAAQNICFEVFRDLAQAERPPRKSTLKTTLVNETVRKIKKLASQKSGKEADKRLKALQKSAESPVSPELHEDIMAPVVNDGVSKEKLMKRLRSAIADLPVREQKAIVMHLFEGASAQKIATRLSVKRTTVNRYLRSASEHLKDELAQLK
jgi:RNA polymerase sigma factor (sigma-70 family)